MFVSYSAVRALPYADTITSPSAKPHRQMDRDASGDNNGSEKPRATTPTTGPNKSFYTKVEVVPGEEPHFRAFS